jgi:beta-galactosidase
MSLDPKDLAPLGNAELSHRRPADLNVFHFGSTYYPEHWDAATRAADAERMAAAGFTLVRMAEFAWDRMEPAEGFLDFTLFDEVIEELGERGIKSMLCTPTATPPRWLTVKHPEVLRRDVDDVALPHGTRQHACHANRVFREYSRRITRDMAEHFCENPHVVGWQTDNEFHCHFSECHCASCQRAFSDFLRHRYDNDIDRLNAAWGNSFWALTYTDFDQILTPRCRPAYANPAHLLDYYRYLSDAVTRFQHEQIEILRGVQPNWWVTHNGTFGHIDYRGLFTRDLDFYGHDVYPMFHHDPARRPAAHALNVDRARCFAGNFMIPEQQSGPGGQGHYMHDNPEPGEIRKMNWTSIARGCDALLHFRWRTCRFGAEEYWCGILDHDNVPRRRYEEIQAFGAEIRRVGPQLLGTHVHVEMAVASGDVDVDDAHSTLSLGLTHPGSVLKNVHGWAFERGYACGCVHPADDLSGLRLYVIPHWAVFDPAWVPGLQRYVESGGTLVLGARTASKDLNNNVIAETAPGCLQDLAGVTVGEYGRQNCPEKRPLDVVFPEGAVRSAEWYEALCPASGTETVATWEGRHLTGQAAVTRRQHGAGAVYYVGAYLTEALVEVLLPRLAEASGLEPLYPEAPAGVQVVQRRSDAAAVWFFINDTDEEISFKPPAGTDLLAEAPAPASLTLARHGVAVIRED